MSKMLKRVTAVAGVAVLGVSSLAGCSTSAKKASSMFEVMGAVSDMEQFTYEITSTMKSSEMDYDMVIYGECDGDAATMSFKIEAEDVDVKLEDFIISTQSMLYINVEAVAALVTSTDMGEFDLGSYGITGDWISIELPEGYEQPEVDFDSMCDELDETYSEYITEKDGKFVLEIADDEVLKNIIGTTVDFIDENSEEWSKDLADAYSEIDMEKMVRDYTSDIIKDINEAFEMEISEDDINKYIDEAIEEMDLSEMEVSASEIKESIDDFKDELDDVKEDATLEGTEIKVTAYQDGKSYITKTEIATYENDEKAAIEFSMVVTEDKSVKVEIPSEKVQTISDVVVSVIEAMGLDEQFDDMLDSMGGMGDDDFSSMFGDDDDYMFDDDDFMFDDDDDFSSMFDDDEFDSEFDDDEFDMYEDDLDDYKSDLWD